MIRKKMIAISPNYPQNNQKINNRHRDSFYRMIPMMNQVKILKNNQRKKLNLIRSKESSWLFKVINII